MADYIPFAVQAEILIRLPTRSLMRFRSVSKTWKALIDSSKFITDYSIQQTHQHHILVAYYDLEKYEQKFLSVVDDDTFPHQKFPLISPIQIGVVLGVSQGVFCFNFGESDYENPQNSIVLWNPCIRKSITIAAPPKVLVSGTGYRNTVGFGVCPHTNDPMLVKINYNATTRQPWQVEVYTLSSRVWRSIPPFNDPRNVTFIRYVCVAIDGFIYWLALDTRSLNHNDMFYDLIISFDMNNYEIMFVSLPDCLAQDDKCGWLSLSRLNGSLVVLETIEVPEKQVFNVWMMKRSVSCSFTKLFTINAPHASIRKLHAFRKNNEPIYGFTTDSNADDVFVYQIDSEQINCVGKHWMAYPSCMETLLLHDQ